jgi:hypothetical protein
MGGAVMARRRLPVECEHGMVLDWGGFGGEDRKPERCDKCGSSNWLATASKEAARDLVWKEFVRKARATQEMRDACDALGLFRIGAVIDTVVDAIMASEDIIAAASKTDEPVQ